MYRVVAALLFVYVAFGVCIRLAIRVADIQNNSSLVGAQRRDKVNEAIGSVLGGNIGVEAMLLLLIASVLLSAGAILSAIDRQTRTVEKAARRQPQDNPFD